MTTTTLQQPTIPEHRADRAALLDRYFAATGKGLITVVARTTGESKGTVSRVWNLFYGTTLRTRPRTKRIQRSILAEIKRLQKLQGRIAA